MLSLTVTPGGTLPCLNLPDGISEDFVNCMDTAGLTFHILESGYDINQTKPVILLLHGFPQLAYSWRTIMLPLAAAGYHVVAVDQRGYGRTTGWDKSPYYQTDLDQFSLSNAVRDMVTLVHALGYTSVRCVVGHDCGSTVASTCALIRPDMFQSCVMMSQAFEGPPKLPSDDTSDRASSGSVSLSAHPRSARFSLRSAPVTSSVTSAGAQEGRSKTSRDPDVHFSLASLPSPRKHYKWYNAFPNAAKDWLNPSQGLSAFLRGYFHLKSAEWEFNRPHPIASWTASELSQVPRHSIMPLHSSMPETIARDMQSEDYDATTSWLPNDDLNMYVEEWERTGFQGALNYYRIITDPARMKDLNLFASKRIRVPSILITGNCDWANFEDPGALQNMPKQCTDFRGVKIVQGAGHWPHQEQPGQVAFYILNFIWNLRVQRKRISRPTPTSPSIPAQPEAYIAKSPPAPIYNPVVATAAPVVTSAALTSLAAPGGPQPSLPQSLRDLGIASAPLKRSEPSLEQILERKMSIKESSAKKKADVNARHATRRNRSVPRNWDDKEPDTSSILPNSVYADPAYKRSIAQETPFAQLLAA